MLGENINPVMQWAQSTMGLVHASAKGGGGAGVYGGNVVLLFLLHTLEK